MKSAPAPATDSSPVVPSSIEAWNRYLVWGLDFPPVTAWQIWLNMGHRTGATLVMLVLSASNLVLIHNDHIDNGPILACALR
jgi:hypothetical protein